LHAGFSDLNSITQWSKGEYPRASNQQDDVAILARKLGVEADEAGDTIATAALLPLIDSKGTTSGIIATQQDVDVYEVTVPEAASLVVTAEPWMADRYTQGNNLDIKIMVSDHQGSVLGVDSPDKSQSCRVSVSLPASGKYYIAVSGVGAPGAYSDYASLGQYTVKAAVTAGVCQCSGSTLTTSWRARNREVTFPQGCDGGHTFSVCLQRQDESSGVVQLELQQRRQGKWRLVSVLPGLQADQQQVCSTYTMSKVKKQSRYRLRFLNADKSEVKLVYGRKRYSASQCEN
jgi:hypothetical protein